MTGSTGLTSPEDPHGSGGPAPRDPFGARLAAERDAHGPLCVGIDPHAQELAAWGLPDDATGAREFGLRLLDAVAGEVAAVKPQSAFFERHGAAGVGVLEELVVAARELGVLCILDLKRGDIGSTARAYAQAYLDPASTLFCDAITASPYLGLGALDPLFELAGANGSGVFVLALTSNPEGAAVQLARSGTSGTVAGAVLAGLAGRNDEELSRTATGGSGTGSFGAVVGATIGSTTENLCIGGPLLAPGLGAQGATAADLPQVFGAALPQVLPSMSRGISRRGPDRGAVRAAVRASQDELRAVLAAR